MKLLLAKLGSFVLLVIWIVPLTVVLSLATGLHSFAFKKDSLRNVALSNGALVEHFLSLKCSCSKRLLSHLKERRASTEVTEIVYLIQANATESEALRRVGYQVQAVDEEGAVQRFNLQALPQLVISINGQITYQGGYGRDQQHTSEYDDVRLIHEATQKAVNREYPIYGCANGKIRKGLIDFVGVKYD